MKTDCTTDQYASLYAPWLATADDFATRFIRPRDRVLDLCGGTGRVATKAMDMGCPKVALLDLNPRAVAFSALEQIKGSANTPQLYFGPHSFDVVVCRQAIGYLDIEKVAKGVAQVLAPGGRFCFNNFRKPRWFWKRYEYRGNRYFEAGWHFGDNCYHIQRRAGCGWDLTKFKWHREHDVITALMKHFTLNIKRTEKTTYFTCVVKDV